MIDIDTVFIIFTAIILAGGLSYLLYYLHNNVFNPSGKGAWKSTSGILSRFATLHGFKALSNIRFEHDGRKYFIENMLIGYFGILFVHTLGGRGDFYGQIDGKTWRRELENEKEIFDNPIRMQVDAMAALRKIFSREKLFNVYMENIVVFTSKSKKTNMYIINDDKILLPRKLSGYIRKTKFENDCGIDLPKAIEIFNEINIKG